MEQTYPNMTTTLPFTCVSDSPNAFWREGYVYPSDNSKPVKDTVAVPPCPTERIVVDTLPSEAKPKEYTGGSVSYYRVYIKHPTNIGVPYVAECNDIIEALGMNYAEGNAFKAIWRSCAARNLGMSKDGYKDGLYDAEKVVFFGKRMIEQAKNV